ncbi:uncharacterized protein LOC105844364 isoform X1 [Hydra vulgaris]|uniref:uncharacterized protein LOC105844364 isoform X1 n=1 Tax=Hydra vulgaris TaxID=6087 RepID=UPI001F5E7C08|nr:uncharacterized protein LOC105844364 [Hydra vulgaris]
MWLRKVIFLVCLIHKVILNEEYIRFTTDWLQWGEWTTCSSSIICNGGIKYRQRKCSFGPQGCVGIESESKDCPKKHCVEQESFLQSPSDVLEAPLSSYINQECDTDIKFFFNGSRKSSIPKVVKEFCKKYIRKFEAGYFATKKIFSISSKIDINVTKFCFEPKKLTIKEARSLTHFNKTSLSSLNSKRKENNNESTVAGLTIAINSKTLSIAAIFFAVSSSDVGYQNVYYKRWKGESVAEAL